MRLIFKIFALPFLLVLSLLAAVLTFLYDVAGWFLSLASGILAVIAVGLFVLQHQPAGGMALFVLVFLLSPYGFPAVAEFLIGLLDELNYFLRRFITSRRAGASGQAGPEPRTVKWRLCGAAVFYGRKRHMVTIHHFTQHVNVGETIAEAIKDCIDYGKSPDKTRGGDLISAYECDPATVDAEFLLSKSKYKAITGREQKRDENILCYQIRQSSLPGEVTPEEASHIGYELDMSWTKGRHASLVTTYIDKAHIHNHTYYNSISLGCIRKFRNFWNGSFAIRRVSDRICLEHGFSIVKSPKPRSGGKFKNYGEWLGDNKPSTFQERSRAQIDATLLQKPADFAASLSLIEAVGYEVKQGRGGFLSFRAPGQERFTRCRVSTLGEGYRPEDIWVIVEGRASLPSSRATEPVKQGRRLDLLIDIQTQLQGRGPAYERWVEVLNLRQMAAALVYLQDNESTGYEQLEKKAEQAAEHFRAPAGKSKMVEAVPATNTELKGATVNYAKTRPVFEAYKAAQHSRKYLVKHEVETEVYRAARVTMSAILDGAEPPKMDRLREEGRKLVTEKKELYAEYREVRREMREVTTAKANIDYLPGLTG